MAPAASRNRKQGNPTCGSAPKGFRRRYLRRWKLRGFSWGVTHLEALEYVHDGVREKNAFESRGKLHAAERLLRPNVVLRQPRPLLQCLRKYYETHSMRQQLYVPRKKKPENHWKTRARKRSWLHGDPRGFFVCAFEYRKNIYKQMNK